MGLTLVDKQDRSVLCEGRNYGIGFAFCKRTGDVLETVQPVSPCKDYLNDVVYSEHSGQPFSAWGLRTSKKNIFYADEGAYVLFQVCKKGARGPTAYTG